MLFKSEYDRVAFEEPKWNYFSERYPPRQKPLVIKFRLKSEEQFRSNYFLGYLEDEPDCICPFNDIIDNIKIEPSHDYYEELRNFIYSNEIELEAWLELPNNAFLESYAKTATNPL